MKPLEQLNNIERAKLLHELMPGLIPDFLTYAKRLVSYTRRNSAELAETWGNQFFSFDAWLELAQEAENKIGQYGQKLAKSSRFFSDQLFGGYTALWSADALQNYVEQPGFTNAKFAALVNAIFGGLPERQTKTPEFVNRYNTLGVDATSFIWQQVAVAKKLVLDTQPQGAALRSKTLYERLPFFTFFRRPGRHESVAITELETPDGKEVHIKGIFTGENYPSPITITLDELDCASALYLADYLAIKRAS